MARQAAARLPERIEWPTLGVAAAIYAGFGTLTWHYDTLPWWLVLPLGGYLIAWHGSLQHEVVHGHPTPWAVVNELLVFPSLWLWLPFRLYRTYHLTHHDDARLTDPLDDPESYYVTAQDWARRGRLGRAGLWALNTLAGRLLLEPFRRAWGLYWREATRLARGDTAGVGSWLLHFLGCAVVLVWVVEVCAVPVGEYLAFFVYPGLSLTLLRSFLEHRAREAVDERTAIVEAGPLMSLLYLNNNLHTLHHLEPATAWYRLPGRYRARRQELLARNGGYLLRGYGEVAARYLLRPKEPPMHPLPQQPAT
ncbi:MAG: fatty acid desaturase [Kiloniellaceae bacterium]